jgi:hypothetical protein
MDEANNSTLTEQEDKFGKNEEYIKKLEEYAESTKKSIDYSVERFDILIISLSTSGLILSIGFVKDILKNFEKINTSLLKDSWLLFTLALIMNLLSQVSGYYANLLDLKITNDIISTLEGNVSEIDKERKDRKMSVLNKFTQFLNGGSLICLILAIIILINFISNNF